MSDLLTYLIQNCLHDPKGDARIDISSKELEGKFEPSQIAYLKSWIVGNGAGAYLFAMFRVRALMHGRGH